jgi:hypothetical protein
MRYQNQIIKKMLVLIPLLKDIWRRTLGLVGKLAGFAAFLHFGKHVWPTF